MPRQRTNELAAGVFVIVCATVLFAVVVWLGDVHFGGEMVYLTVPLSEGNTGISEGSYVYLGLERIGSVERVRLLDDGQTFLIEARVNAPQAIHRDALVRTASPALSGDTTLVFHSAGSAEAGKSTPEQPIAVFLGSSSIIKDMAREVGFGAEQRTQFQQIIASLEGTARNVEAVSSTLQKELSVAGDQNLLGQIRGVMTNLHATAAQVRQIVTALSPQFDTANESGAVAKVHRSLDDINRTTGDLQQLVESSRPEVEKLVAAASDTAQTMQRYTREDVAEVLKNLRAGSDDLVLVMRDFRAVSGAARDAMEFNRENIDEILANLTQASTNLKGATREIRASPWKLLGKPSVEDVRTENIQLAARAFADGASGLDTALKRMQEIAGKSESAIPADDPQLLEVRNKVKDAYLKFSQAEQALWKELAQ